jgi:hypothetical protein
MRPSLRSTLALLVTLCCWSCGPTGTDDGGVTQDAGVADAGRSDAGTPDAGPADAGAIDAGGIDAGPSDAGAVDAGALDAGPPDAGDLDAGLTDAGTPDAGAVDAGCGSLPGCGAGCCASGDVCNFGHCETPGTLCSSSADCAAADFCDFSVGTLVSDAGVCGPVPSGHCLARPPSCGLGADAGAPSTCLPACTAQPQAPFSMSLRASWGGVTTTPFSTDVMMTPLVMNLDDDNCDGKVDQRDVPEIIFSTFTGGAYYKQGTLHAVSLLNGTLVDKWSRPNTVQPGGQLAAADLDGDGVPEIVACMDPGPSGTNCCDATAQNTGVIAFRADGTTLWTQSDTSKVHCGYEAPALGDVDGDGLPDVLVGWTVLDGRTGAVKLELDPSSTWGAKLTSLADLDGDGHLDVTDGQRALRADGTVLWDLRTGPDATPAGYHAIADLDGDGRPEVIISSSSGPHTLTVLHADATTASHVTKLRSNVNLNGDVKTTLYCNTASEYGGGPPLVADLDGDGHPDIGVATAVGYVAFNGLKVITPSFADTELLLWQQLTHDCASGVTGSSAFDFLGQGHAQVVSSDEWHLQLYDGTNGVPLNPSTCNTTGTLWEYPVVADVDGDGRADLVVASNAYATTCPDNGSKQSGVRVFSGDWARARATWNEYDYHVTNVRDDGTVPSPEPSNWLQPGLDDARQASAAGERNAAPNAVVSLAPSCHGDYGLVATVRNVGQAPLPAGVTVGFYSGAASAPTLLGTGVTTRTLGPAEAERVVLPLPQASTPITAGQVPLSAVVDDGATPHLWQQCTRADDTSTPVLGSCPP